MTTTASQVNLPIDTAVTSTDLLGLQKSDSNKEDKGVTAEHPNVDTVVGLAGSSADIPTGNIWGCLQSKGNNRIERHWAGIRRGLMENIQDEILD
ncbi:hypothetical protein FB451DRAFT_1557234 [Mycena latifolia]|nr:hypothetical protein FB451DRAFT_1557234 [Mycena latifolia]